MNSDRPDHRPYLPTVTIEKSIEFDAGHRVPTHGSKCRHPHGHRYRVIARATGPVISCPGATDDGMVMDFGDLKKILTEEAHDPFDHAFLVYREDAGMLAALEVLEQEERKQNPGFVLRKKICDFVPTAECLAVYIFRQVAERLKAKGLKLSEIEVFETPTSSATFGGP